ncbi:hypothetical protein EDC04DRAFT_2784241 [Pisolithus marmoratus]|nr:hypothetical protein EDC04DRAFT_2784241 [Pisolithus marmoratus]
MANEKEVKAQVKLRFHAANGTRMLVVRNLSVTAKKTGLTMKTLESILALADSNVEKGGKRGAISTKCAEIDTEIPHLLGVSKSVLENVIFCHQEDSYWPLAEPSILKKKFDDIFEATRYTKALEINTTKRKREYEQLVKNNARFYESATKFREIYVKVENLQQKKEHYRQELADARETVQEMEGTHSDALTSVIVAYTTSTRTLFKLAKARRTHVELVNEHGELAAEAKVWMYFQPRAHERRITEREELIRDISGKHNIKGYSHSPLEREKVNEFISRLGDLQRRQHADYKKLQAEYNQQSRQLHTERGNAQDQIKERQASIAKAESSLATMQGLAPALRTLTGDIEEKKLRLEKIKGANHGR